MTSVRRLGTGDGSAYRALNALFAEAFEDSDSYASAPPPDDWVARLLAKPDLVLLVAETEGTLVGGAAAYVLDKFEQARREIYLFDLAVAESHRRRGIATALIRELQALAIELGAWTVYVQADPEDHPAVALYESLGSRAEVFHFDFSPQRR